MSLKTCSNMPWILMVVSDPSSVSWDSNSLSFSEQHMGISIKILLKQAVKNISEPVLPVLYLRNSGYFSIFLSLTIQHSGQLAFPYHSKINFYVFL
jgi:hypothetical protein